MDPTITIVVQGLAFFAVAWLVMKFGWPNIIAAIEDRQKKIAEGLAAAERGEKSLAEARTSANDIIKEAHARAAKIVEAMARRGLKVQRVTPAIEAERVSRIIGGLLSDP